MSTFLSFVFLLALHRSGINYFPPGPLALLFSILYQHYRIVPATYHFRISYLDISNKAFTYFLGWLVSKQQMRMFLLTAGRSSSVILFFSSPLASPLEQS